MAREAKSFSTTRSSAEQARSVIAPVNLKFEARLAASFSNGSAPSETSMPTSSGVYRRSTRFRLANAAASSMYSPSRPNPVRSVRSTSRVTRGSPHPLNCDAADEAGLPPLLFTKDLELTGSHKKMVHRGSLANHLCISTIPDEERAGKVSRASLDASSRTSNTLE